MKNQRLGFTLIELLVVIAIIAILAAILFPVFAKAREKARATSCVSNLKNIGMGFLMYSQDFDEIMPPWRNIAGSFNLSDLYPNLVGPYIKNGVNTATGELGQVWACLSSKSGGASIVSNTYAYNYYGLGGTGSPNPNAAPLSACYAPFNAVEYVRAAPVPSLARPGEMIMITDGAQLSRPPIAYTCNGPNAFNNGVWGSHENGNGNVAPATSSGPGWTSKLVTGRRTNVAYVDGHVKGVLTQSLVSQACVMENGAWRGALAGDNTPAGNAGWLRNW